VPLLTGTAPTAAKLLAIDALGTLGDGVDAGLRAELARMLAEPPFGTAPARLLGCLQRLGAVPEIAAERKLRLARTATATADTWLAAAAPPAVDPSALGAELARRDRAQRIAAVARIARHFPAAVDAWLGDAERGTRYLTLEGLVALADDAPLPVTVRRLVALVGDADADVRRLALRLLARHPDRAAVAASAAAALPALARHASERWHADDVKAWIERAGVDAATWVRALEPALRAGHAWELVVGLQDVDRGAMRERARAWSAATADGDARLRLLAAAVRLGALGDERSGDGSGDGHARALVRAALAGPAAADVLSALADAPALPAELRADLEAMVDRGLAPDAGEAAVLGARAREVLLRHFAR
jgi:hypothetical protein